ncbi:MAG TPA: hypothetical protein DEV93_05780 [Chloroflexi bacterium]|jgi:hypothetical protein|nr:hypothetical protein [Chloroflexota bacterium]
MIVKFPSRAEFLCVAVSMTILGASILRPSSVLGAPEANGAVSPIRAVQILVGPFYKSSAQRQSCNALKGQLTSCPLTARLIKSLVLERRYEQTHASGGNGNIFCRCQNPPMRVIIKRVVPHGLTARVLTVWQWDTEAQNLTFVTRHTTRGWRIANEFCTANPARDMYHFPIGPCS